MRSDPSTVITTFWRSALVESAVRGYLALHRFAFDGFVGGARSAWIIYSDGPRPFTGAAPSSVHSGGMPTRSAIMPVTPGPRPNASQAAYLACRCTRDAERPADCV
jgi:hypothetical protein